MKALPDSPQRWARWAGFMYLAIIALGLAGEAMVRGSLVVGGDPAATAQRIAENATLWRLGIGGDLLMHVLDVPVTLLLYLLLRPVHHGAALLATVTNLVQTAVLSLNKLNLMLPLLMLDPARHLQDISLPQLQSLAYLAIQLHSVGFGIGLIFFGVTCVVRGWLLMRSGYFPRWLGVMLWLAGLAYLVNSFSLILAPTLARALFPAVLLPAFVGELALALWLVFKGVDLRQWPEPVKGGPPEASGQAL